MTDIYKNERLGILLLFFGIAVLIFSIYFLIRYPQWETLGMCDLSLGVAMLLVGYLLYNAEIKKRNQNLPPVGAVHQPQTHSPQPIQPPQQLQNMIPSQQIIIQSPQMHPYIVCQYCGQANPVGIKACQRCGAPLP